LKSTITFIFAILLSACAARVPLQESQPVPVPLQEQQASADAKAAATKQPADDSEEADADSPDESAEEDVTLPSIPLTSELLYTILASDFAYQGGYWQPAYAAKMELAEKTRDPRIAKHAAEMAIKAHHIDKSLAAAKLWHELAPSSEDAERYYLAFLVLGDDLLDARPIFTQRLKNAPPEERGVQILQVQHLLSVAKNKGLAFTVLEDVLAPYSSMLESHIAFSLAAFSIGDKERAIEEANKALAIKPSSELAALARAQALGDPAEMTKSLAQFLAAYPKSREVRIAYARMLIAQKQYSPARKEFETLLASQPRDPVSLYSLAILSLQVNDVKSAERYLNEYLEVITQQQRDGQDFYQVFFLLAQIAEDQGDHETALKWLDKVERESGDSAAYLRARFKSAQIIAKNGNVTGARKLLAGLHPETTAEHEQIILAEAQILREAKLPQEAFSVLAAGVEQIPDNANLLYDYALAAEGVGKPDVMERALRRIFVLDPVNYQAYNALGYSLADRNVRLNEAFELIAKALKLAPDDPFIMDSMGWVLYRQGNLPEAEKRLRQAYKLRPDAEIAVHLGEVLWVAGQKDEAQKLWAEAGKKEPNNELLKKTLNRFTARP